MYQQVTATSAPNVLNRSWSRATRCVALPSAGGRDHHQTVAGDRQFAGEKTIYGSIRLTNRQTFRSTAF